VRERLYLIEFMASRRNGNTIVAVLEAKKELLGVPADFPTSKEPGWKS
jgi:hypothetical protein